MDGPPVLRAGLPPGAGRKIGQLTQREIELEGGARKIQRLDRAAEGLLEKIGRKQVNEGNLRPGIREDELRLDLFPRGQPGPSRLAIFNQDRLNSAAGTDLDAKVPGGRGDGLAESPHASSNISPDPAGAIGLAHDMMEEYVGRARRPGACHRADDRICRERYLELLALEPLIQQAGGAAGEHPEKGIELLAEPTGPEAQPGQAEKLAGPADSCKGIGRRTVKRRLEHLDHAPEHGLVALVGCRVTIAEFRDLPAVELGIRPEEEMLPTRKGSKGGGLPGQHLEAVVTQLQLPDDLRPKERVHVGQAGKPVARDELLGDSAAAHQLPALQDQDLSTRPGQIAGGDQAVVPRPDDNRVVFSHFSRAPLNCRRQRPYRSRRS